jgi:hypothetical protein
MKWDTDGGNGWWWWWWWWLRVVRMSNDSANANRGSNGLSPHLRRKKTGGCSPWFVTLNVESENEEFR